MLMCLYTIEHRNGTPTNHFFTHPAHLATFFDDLHHHAGVDPDDPANASTYPYIVTMKVFVSQAWVQAGSPGDTFETHTYRATILDPVTDPDHRTVQIVEKADPIEGTPEIEVVDFRMC